jgi:hypothetical protein
MRAARRAVGLGHVLLGLAAVLGAGAPAAAAEKKPPAPAAPADKPAAAPADKPAADKPAADKPAADKSPAEKLPAPAGARPAAPRAKTAKTFPRLATPSMSHHLQFGIALLPGTGYRAIFPYQEGINCGQLNKRVCSGRLPTFLDVQPSFGFAERWDVLIDLRFGLEEDFMGSREFALAPGVRYWVDPQDQWKFFTTVQVVYDATPQHQQGVLPHNDDIAVRNSNGFMFEVMRNFGAYVQFGETIGFRRWLRFEIDAGVGVQARLP